MSTPTENEALIERLKIRAHEFSSGTTQELLFDAAAALEAAEAKLADVWDEGKRAGMSRAMRHMSDEPGLSLEILNPYAPSVSPGGEEQG